MFSSTTATFATPLVVLDASAASGPINTSSYVFVDMNINAPSGTLSNVPSDTQDNEVCDTSGDKDSDTSGDEVCDTYGDKDSDTSGDDLSIVNRITKTFNKNGSVDLSNCNLEGVKIIELVEKVINNNPTKLLCLNLANNKFSIGEIFKLTSLLKKCSSLLDFDMTNTELNNVTLTFIVSALPTTLQYLRIGNN